MKDWFGRNRKMVALALTAVAVGIAYAIGGMDAVAKVINLLGTLGLAPEVH